MKMNSHRVTLVAKQGASILVHAYPGSSVTDSSPATLVVFLNALISPQTGWNPTLDILLSNRQSTPALLTYDRYGQGDSDRDPSDAPDTVYGHTAMDVITDLHQLLLQVCADILHIPPPGADTQLVIVANSIGCPLARLYAAEHPGTVAAYLFLDSMMANSDFVSLFPDPDAAGFDPDALPRDVSMEAIRHARMQAERMFHPNVPNPEHFDRRNLRALLPYADKPVLPDGADGRPPLLTVVGHDWDVFAQQTLEGSMAIPIAITNAYMNPVWHKYNRGLTRLTSRDGPQEPIIAQGYGHLIQKDDPGFVAKEIGALLDQLGG